jgi:hypothetical protein
MLRPCIVFTKHCGLPSLGKAIRWIGRRDIKISVRLKKTQKNTNIYNNVFLYFAAPTKAVRNTEKGKQVQGIILL